MSITTRAPYGFEAEAMPLEAFGGVGGYRLKPIPGSLQLHGGGVKKVAAVAVGVAAAVAIPVAAPAVASAVAGSAWAATAGAAAVTAASVAGGALAGAAIGAAGGAVSSAIAGGDVGRGALMGGIGGAVGGGISSYGAAAAPAADAATTATGTGLGPTNAAAQSGQLATAPTASPATGLTTAAPPTTGGLSTATGAPGVQGIDSISQQVAAGGTQTFASPVPSTAMGSIGSTLSGTAGTTGGVGGTAIPSVTAQAPVTPTFGATTPTGLGPTLDAARTGQLATAPVAGTTPAADAAADQNFLSSLGSELKSRVTDPKLAADIVLRGAGQLAGSALAGSGLSEQQQQLVDMQAAELEQLRQTNQAAFNQRLQEAQRLVGESRYFDPEYFGLQRAREQQTAGAQAKRAGLRGLTGEERRAEARRYDIATGRNVGTAYDQGYLTGVQGRLQTQEAGLRQLPMPNQYRTDYSGLGTTLQNAETQRLKAAQNVGKLFGGLTGYSSSRSTG